jgi:hypothetical protein
MMAESNLLFPFLCRFCMIISFPYCSPIPFIVIPLLLSPDIPQEAQKISHFSQYNGNSALDYSGK